MTATRRAPIVTATDAPPPFDPAWFETVFVVSQPPATWPAVFAIVTAHNPDGRLSPDRENKQLEGALDEFLRSVGIESFAVTGASPDLRHQETGRGLRVRDLALAASVAARFRQEGFFWVEESTLFICTDASGSGWRMAKWEERLVSKRP